MVRKGMTGAGVGSERLWGKKKGGGGGEEMIQIVLMVIVVK